MYRCRVESYDFLRDTVIYEFHNFQLKVSMQQMQIYANNKM